MPTTREKKQSKSAKKPTVKHPAKKPERRSHAKKETEEKQSVKKTAEAAAEKTEKTVEREKEHQTVADKKYFYAVGKRKSASAKVRLFEGKAQVKVNGRPFEKYFVTRDFQKEALSPLAMLGLENRMHAEIFVAGGGTRAQAGAVRHAFARALVVRNAEDKATLKKSGFLTRDPRVKERKKPGLKRARRAPQWSKR